MALPNGGATALPPTFSPRSVVSDLDQSTKENSHISSELSTISGMILPGRSIQHKPLTYAEIVTANQGQITSMRQIDSRVATERMDLSNSEVDQSKKTPSLAKITREPTAGRRVGNLGKEWSENDVKILMSVVHYYKNDNGTKRFLWREVRGRWDLIRNGESAYFGILDNCTERSSDALSAKYRSLSKVKILPSPSEIIPRVENLEESVESHIAPQDTFEEFPLEKISIAFKEEIQKALRNPMRKPLFKPKKELPPNLIKLVNQLIVNQFKNRKDPITLDYLNAVTYAAGHTILAHGKENDKAKQKIAKHFELDLVQKEKRLRRFLAMIYKELQRRKNHKSPSDVEKQALKRLRQEFKNLRRLRDFVNLKETLVVKLKYVSSALKRMNDEKLRKRIRKLPPKKALVEMKGRDSGHIPIDKIRSYWSGFIGESKNFRMCSELRDWKSFARQPPLELDSAALLVMWDALCKKASPWKASGPDGIPNWLWKHIPAAQNELYKQVTYLLKNERTAPKWFSHGRAVLLYKKGDRLDPGNYRTIVCLNTCYKLCSGLIAKWVEKQVEGVFPTEQLACRKGIWGCVEAHIIDATLTRDAIDQKRRELSVAWIDFSKAFDSVPHDYVRWVLKAIGVSGNIRLLLRKLMENWSIQYEQNSAKGKIRSKPLKVKNGLLQGDSLSPLLFCICIAPISHWLNTRLPPYETSFRRGSDESLKKNHLYFMDDLKMYTPNSEELKRVIHELGKLLDNIGGSMNFPKCGLSHSIHKIGRNDDDLLIPTIGDKEAYKYLGIEQNTRICSNTLWERVSKDLIQRSEQIFCSQMTVRQMISTYNCMVPSVVRFISTNIIIGRGKFESDRARFANLDSDVRKILCKCKLRYKTQNCARIYMDSFEGGLGLIKLVDTYEESIVYTFCYLTCSPHLASSLHFMESLESRNKRSIVSDSHKVLNSYRLGTMVTTLVGGLRIEESFYKAPTEAAQAIVQKMRSVRKEHARRLIDPNAENALGFSSLARITDYERWNLDKRHTWDWLVKGVISPLVLRNITAAQENLILYTNLGNDGKIERCRWNCKDKLFPDRPVSETVAHIVSNCDNWSSTIYVQRHNMVARNIYYELCIKYGLPPIHYSSTINPVRENERVKLYWDRTVDNSGCRYNRPDIVCFEKVMGSDKFAKIWVIEISVAWYQHLLVKHYKKFDKYATNSMELTNHPGRNLQGELAFRYNCPVITVPVVMGVFGEVSNVLANQLTKLQIPGHSRLVERLSRSAVVGTHWVLKAHLSMKPTTQTA